MKERSISPCSECNVHVSMLGHWLLFCLLFSLQLLSKPEYSGVEKIKTIGPTYMLAAGLDQPLTQHCPADMLADFAKSMFEVITEINAHAFQNFKLRIGELTLAYTMYTEYGKLYNT